MQTAPMTRAMPDASNGSGYDLRYADGAVEQSEISSHVSVSLQGIGDEGERHGQYGGPGATDEKEGHEEHIGIAFHRAPGEADAAEDEAEGVSYLTVAEAGQYHGPDHAAQCLYGIEHAYPVTSFLISGTDRIGGAPAVAGDGAVGVGPHIHEGEPTEELDQSYLPEGCGSMSQQMEPAARVFTLLLLGLFADPVILSVFLGVPFVYVEDSIDDAEDEDESARGGRGRGSRRHCRHYTESSGWHRPVLSASRSPCRLPAS